MNELIKIADKLYAEKKWEEARKAYTHIIDNYLYDIPIGVISKLAISQRMLKHYEGSEKTLKLGFEKFPNDAALWRERGALENCRENWDLAIEFWKKGYSLSKKLSLLSFQRYAVALHEYCKSRGDIYDKVNENTCITLKSLIEEAFSIYGDSDKKLKSILNSIVKKTDE